MFQIKFTERNRTCCRFLFFANWLQRPFWSCARSIFQRKSLGDEIEWRSVTSRYHGSQISGSQPILLYRDGHLHHRTMEDHAIMHGKVIHFMPYMFVFSWQICKFSFPLYRARSCITVILRAEFDATVRLREVIALASQENNNKKKQNKLNCCSEQLYGVLDCRCSSWQLLGMKGTI